MSKPKISCFGTRDKTAHSSFRLVVLDPTRLSQDGFKCLHQASAIGTRRELAGDYSIFCENDVNFNIVFCVMKNHR